MQRSPSSGWILIKSFVKQFSTSFGYKNRKSNVKTLLNFINSAKILCTPVRPILIYVQFRTIIIIFVPNKEEATTLALDREKRNYFIKLFVCYFFFFFSLYSYCIQIMSLVTRIKSNLKWYVNQCSRKKLNSNFRTTIMYTRFISHDCTQYYWEKKKCVRG